VPLQYLGVLALQSNRPAPGIDAIGSALALNEPTRSHYQAGYALYQLRRVDDAVAHYWRRSRWRRCRPADQGMTNLAFWHLFETENPDTFAGVYKFWVQKKAD
jgi:hypothetical protein